MPDCVKPVSSCRSPSRPSICLSSRPNRRFKTWWESRPRPGAQIAELPARATEHARNLLAPEKDRCIRTARLVGTRREQIDAARRHPAAARAEADVGRQHLDGAAHCVAAELRACRPEHRFDTPALAGIDEREVLVRPRTEGRVVQPHAIDEVEHLVSGQAAQKRRHLAVGALLHHHAGRAFEGIADRGQWSPAEVTCRRAP